MVNACNYQSPFGMLTLLATDRGLTGVLFHQKGQETGGIVTKKSILNPQAWPSTEFVMDDKAFATVISELDSYFKGDLTQFTFEIDYGDKGTPFQREVWEALRTIPYGSVVTYGELAVQIGNPRAARAVGLANNRNPLAIVVPCHRVIGSSGSLVGYAGGLPFKRALLELEGGSAGQDSDKTTSETILQRGAEVFAKSGFGGARIDAIAAQASINKRMIYHHFGSKRQLYREVLNRIDDLELQPHVVMRLKLFEMLEDPEGNQSQLGPEIQRRTQKIVEMQSEGKIGPEYNPQLLARMQYLIDHFGDLFPPDQTDSTSKEEMWQLLARRVKTKSRVAPVIRPVGHKD